MLIVSYFPFAHRYLTLKRIMRRSIRNFNIPLPRVTYRHSTSLYRETQVLYCQIWRCLKINSLLSRANSSERKFYEGFKAQSMCRKSQLLFFPLTKKFIRAFENSLCPVIFKKSIFARSNAEEGGGNGGRSLPEGMLKLPIDRYIITIIS